MKGKEFQDRKVVVTGGAGFIGSHLVDKLVELGADVKVLDDLSYGRKINLNERANFEKVNITDYEAVRKSISKTEPEAVYHLAANATTRESSMGWKDPIADYRINTFGTLNLLRASMEKNINPHFIFASSAAVYGEPQYTPMDENHPTNPQSPYGISKLTSEKYLLAYQREHGIPATILRIFNCYGPRQPRYVMFDFLRKLEENPDKLEVIGTGEQVRTYCYISDAVDAIIDVAKKEPYGEVLNLAGEDVLSIRDLAEKIVSKKELEGRTKIKYTGESWEGDIKKLIADTSKIREELDFKPRISLETGLNELKKWFKTEFQSQQSHNA